MKTHKENALAWGAVIRRILLLLLLIAAGVLAISEKQEIISAPPAVTPTLQPANRDRRTDRETAYDKDLEALKLLLQSEDEAMRTQAQQRMALMIAEHQTEWAIEEALKQAGFSSAFAVMQNGAVTVMVDAGQLTEENSARILALCTAHADVGAENVRIMNASP